MPAVSLRDEGRHAEAARLFPLAAAGLRRQKAQLTCPPPALMISASANLGLSWLDQRRPDLAWPALHEAILVSRARYRARRAAGDA